MKTTDKFTYVSKWGKKIEGCHFFTYDYWNENNYLEIRDSSDETYIVCSVNGQRMNNRDEITIKNYSENEGMVKFLQDMGIIEKEPIDIEHRGCSLLPTYKLTESGKELFG